MKKKQRLWWWVSPWLPVWPWAKCLVSGDLSFSVCKVWCKEVISVNHREHCLALFKGSVNVSCYYFFVTVKADWQFLECIKCSVNSSYSSYLILLHCIFAFRWCVEFGWGRCEALVVLHAVLISKWDFLFLRKWCRCWIMATIHTYLVDIVDFIKDTPENSH